MAYTGKKPTDFVDVTQTKDFTVTEDLTVDTDTLVVDSANDRVGINNNAPAAPLDIKLNTDNTEDIFKFQRNDGAVAGVLNYSGTDGAISLGTTTSHDFTFDTANTERLRILSGGGITFNGDTAAANALSDYEEGTWIPVLKAGGGTKTWSYNGQAGKYTKIGDTVTVWFNLQLSSNGSGTDGNAYIDGLPFANGVGFSVYTVAWKQLVETSEVGLMLRLDNANSYFWVIDGSSSYPDISYINTSNFLSDRRIRGQFTYKV